MGAHTTSDDPTRYRLADETEAWKMFDPIERVRVYLTRSGGADQKFFDGVQAEADQLAARFRAFTVAMPTPGPERMFSHVYTAPHHQIDRQQVEYLEYLAGFDTDGGGAPPATNGHAGPVTAGGAQ